MPDRHYKVLAIASHPVQYMSPIFRRMAAIPELDLKVAYCSLRGAEAGHDPEFGTTVQWDVPLLEGYSWVELPNEGSGAESFFGLRNPSVAPLIRNGNFDAVLCFVGYVRSSFWSAYLAARSTKTAFLFGTDAHSLDPRNGGRWKKAAKRICWPFLFRLADQVIVPSTGTHQLIRALGIPEQRITLTPYSVDNTWWIEQSRLVNREAVRAAWRAKENDAVILYCAKLQPWKRPGDLLRAFAKTQLVNALLVIAGVGPLQTELVGQAQSLGIAERTRFLGFVNQSQLPAVYSSADLMVLPSEYEPFAVTVNEAMCCGCPVAASNHVGAAQDLIVPVQSDFVFPCGDIDALASLLLKAAGDRTRLAGLRATVLSHIQTWSPERNIEATMDAIRIAVDRKRHAPKQAVSDPSSIPPSSAMTAKSRE
ncbi:MAG TPA: glycosyltransferase [Candidatus Acidoferrum sp.]|nr:glycosyltransferase [Candidatus Acidoferrum sp.]